MLIRVSIGTLAKLGLVSINMLAEPHTAYLLQYRESGCLARCLFCAQSSMCSGSKDYLSRVLWPTIELEKFLNSWKRGLFQRICIQSIVKSRFVEELMEIVRSIKSVDGDTPISLAVTPISIIKLKEFKVLGVDMIGIGLDVAEPYLHRLYGKPFDWHTYMNFIEKAIKVFGKGKVMVHVIVGLGESVKSVLLLMKKLYALGARIALFNYTYTPGTVKRPPPDVRVYRILQIARCLLERGLDPEKFIDIERFRIIRDPPIDNILDCFLTAGCPGCNRPFYNESPRGKIYNYPSMELLLRDLPNLLQELESIGVFLS